MKTILVVEDDVVQNQHIRRILENHQYRVISAFNGNEGISKSIHYKPNLIMMDIFLPDMRGTEATVQIKNNSHTSHIPIIFCSSELDFKENNPHVAFLPKPYSAKELLDYVVKFI